MAPFEIIFYKEKIDIDLKLIFSYRTTMHKNYNFTTDRLEVKGWHSWGVEELGETLPSIIKRTLTAAVTHNLPPIWQGEYTLQRATNWIEELDREATPLLVVDSDLSTAIGLVILFEIEQKGDDSHLRLGYLFSETSWGKGYATELVAGFVTWCKEHSIASTAHTKYTLRAIR